MQATYKRRPDIFQLDIVVQRISLQLRSVHLLDDIGDREGIYDSRAVPEKNAGLLVE